MAPNDNISPAEKVAAKIVADATPREVPGAVAAQRVIAAIATQYRFQLNDFLSGLVGNTAAIIANQHDEKQQMVLLREVTSTIRDLVERANKARKAEAAAAEAVARGGIVPS